MKILQEEHLFSLKRSKKSNMVNFTLYMLIVCLGIATTALQDFGRKYLPYLLLLSLFGFYFWFMYFSIFNISTKKTRKTVLATP